MLELVRILLHLLDLIVTQRVCFLFELLDGEVFAHESLLHRGYLLRLTRDLLIELFRVLLVLMLEPLDFVLGSLEVLGISSELLTLELHLILDLAVDLIVDLR